MLWSILTLLIGVVFIISLLSLLATTAMESIAGMLKLRGRNLERALRNMLSSTDVNQTVYRDFIDHSLFRQLAKNPGQRGSKPSYMRREDFQTILLDLLSRYHGAEIHDMANLQAAITKLPDVDLRNTLTSLVRESHGDMNRWRTNVQSWYDSVMERAGGWYKRTTKKILFALGCLMAVGFNADTINIFHSLQSDPQNMQQVMGMVNSFLGEPAATAFYPGAYPAGGAYTAPNQALPYNPQAAVSSQGGQPYQPQGAPPASGSAAQGFQPYQPQGAPSSDSPQSIEPYQPQATTQPGTASGFTPYQGGGDPQPYQPPAGNTYNGGIYGIKLSDIDQGNNRDYLQRMFLQELQSARSPFGIGWSDFNLEQMTTDSWILKLLGWFITAMAISFGSPFWFDVLRKVANVSSSGRVN